MVNSGTTALSYEPFTYSNVGLLDQEIIVTYPYPEILLGDGDYAVNILGYDIGYISVRLMASNIYTTQFATKAELSSSITQTKNEINLVVNEKLDEEDFTSANILLMINNDVSTAKIGADKISLAGSDIDLSTNNITISSNNFSVTTDGEMTCSNANITGGTIYLTQENEDDDFNSLIQLSGQTLGGNSYEANFTSNSLIFTSERHGYETETAKIVDGDITCVTLTQTSLEKDKKNISKYTGNALEQILNTDIYEYNLNNENDKSKKHIGFVIGDKYNYSKKITSVDKNNNETGVDNYSFTSLCCKAIQEQQKIIEDLQKQINELKGVE